MSRGCGECAQLRARLDFLRQVLAQALGGVRSLTAFIEAEQDTPTMAARQMPAAIHARLTLIAEYAEGKTR